MTKQGHPSFAQWVADEESGLYELELILTEGVDGKPTPKLPTVEQVIDWIFSYSSGGAPKGGSKEYRAGPWYAKMSGKTQAAQLMSGAAKAFGFGKYTHILLTELLTELLTSGLVMHYSLSNERLRVSNALLSCTTL